MSLDIFQALELVAELKGHEDVAWHLAWNPTKPLLASCSSDKNVRMYAYTQPADGSIPIFSHITTIPTGHTKTVRSLAWSTCGKSLATASFDSNTGIWEKEAGEEEDSESGDWECVSLLEGHETECKSVGYSTTGALLASCSRDKTVWIWEVKPDSDFECMAVLMEHSQDVKCVAWHPAEEILASASYDDTIKLYIDDPSDDWFCFATLVGHTSTVWSISWSPNGQFLASGSDDRTVRIWKRVQEHQWDCVLILTGHERSVYSIHWGTGKGDPKTGYLGWLASVGSDGSIRVWELTEHPSSDDLTELKKKPLTQRLIALQPSAHSIHEVNAVAWCPRKGLEDVLATVGDDGTMRVWRLKAEVKHTND